MEILDAINKDHTAKRSVQHHQASVRTGDLDLGGNSLPSAHSPGHEHPLSNHREQSQSLQPYPLYPDQKGYLGMEGDAPNVHRSGTRAPGDVKSRKEPPACKCPLHPSADVLRPPGTQLRAVVAPRDFYELQSSTWLVSRPGRGCSQVRNQLQKVLFAATPPSRCTQADAQLLVCCDGESCHHTRLGHKDNSEAVFYNGSEQHRARSPNWVHSTVPGMLKTSSTRPHRAPSLSRGRQG